MKRLKILLISLLVSFGVSAALLAVTALVIAKAEILPRGTVVLITTVIGCVAIFTSALVSSVLIKENGALTGLLCGLAFVLIIAIVSAAAFKNEFTVSGAGRAAAYLLSGVIIGILGVNRKSKVKF